MKADVRMSKAAAAMIMIMAMIALFAMVTPVSALYLSDEPASEGLEYIYNSDGTAAVKEWMNNNILRPK